INAVRGAVPVFPISEPLAPHGPHRRRRDSSRSRRWHLGERRLRIGPCIGKDVLETAVVKRVLLEAIGSWLPSKADRRHATPPAGGLDAIPDRLELALHRAHRYLRCLARGLGGVLQREDAGNGPSR